MHSQHARFWDYKRYLNSTLPLFIPMPLGGTRGGSADRVPPPTHPPTHPVTTPHFRAGVASAGHCWSSSGPTRGSSGSASATGMSAMSAMAGCPTSRGVLWLAWRAYPARRWASFSYNSTHPTAYNGRALCAL